MKNGKVALCVILLFVVLTMGGIGIVCYGKTLASVWIGAGVAFVVASAMAPLFIPLWHRLTGSIKTWICLLCHYAFAGSLVFMLVFGFNYWCSDASSASYVKAEISSKYRKEHNRTRRVGRGRMIYTGEKWYSYFLTLTLPDGRTKDIEVPLSTYNRKSTGAIVEIETQRGLFGMDVIKEYDFKPRRQ